MLGSVRMWAGAADTLMQTDRIHARGPRGEAVIILMQVESDGSTTYRLATGERLVRDDKTGVFSTLGGKRAFRAV
jgi:hypothetical protein